MQPSYITIKNAGPSHIEQMVPLLKQLFAIETDFVFDPEKQKKGLSRMIEGCGRHRAVKIAVLGTRVVGMCTVQTRISTATGELCAIVEDLVVDKNHRGKKIGPALLDRIYIWADKRRIRQFQLLADRKNTAALQFYNAQGWQRTDLVCLTRKIASTR